MPAELLRANVGLEVERQLAAAAAIEADIDRLAPMLAWHGIPDRDELAAASELIWEHLNGGRREHGAFSPKQLAFQISRLRDAADVRDLIEAEIDNPYRIEHEHPIDRIVEDVLDFLRHWPGHTFPRLLMALDRIAKEVLGRHGRRTGDFTVFAALVENMFLPAPVMALEEYGLPRTVSLRLLHRLEPEGGLDENLARLAHITDEPPELDPFELELLEDVRSSLPEQG